jgi:ProP effector
MSSMNAPAHTSDSTPAANANGIAAAPAANPVHEARKLLKTLQENFAVFREHKPLAIGVDKQIIARESGVNRKVLRIALGLHTRSVPYLKAMEKATVRFDLEGNAAGEVPEEHRKHAADTLRERFKKAAEQRKVQRETEQAERRHAEKLNALAAKFSRNK